MMKRKKMEEKEDGREENFVVDNDGKDGEKGAHNTCIWYGLRSLPKYVIVDR